MSAENITDIGASQSIEPANLREAYTRAKFDLNKPTNEAHLRWVFWHARAVAAHEDARLYLDDLRLWDRSVQSMQMGVTSQFIKDQFAPARPGNERIAEARTALVDAAAMLEVTRAVVALLDKTKR